jgi:hypothetical protein
MFALVGVGGVDTGMCVGFERVEAGVVVISSERGELEWFEGAASAECFVEWGFIGVFCQWDEGRG